MGTTWLVVPGLSAWKPTPVFLPGESHGQRSLAGYSPWGCKKLDITEHFHFHFFPSPGASFHLPPHLKLSPPPSPPPFTHDYQSHHRPSENLPCSWLGPSKPQPPYWLLLEESPFQLLSQSLLTLSLQVRVTDTAVPWKTYDKQWEFFSNC